MEGTSYTTERLDHLGIVAGVCQRIGLIEQVDGIVGPTGRKVSVGQAVQAMVINGLGFVSRPLYLTPEFFVHKPVDVLVGEGLRAEDFNDDSLGRALDRLYEAGLTGIFARVASHAVHELGIAKDVVHLDSSSFSLHGRYDRPAGDPQAIEVSYGYSRDRRPDLKQIVVSLICSHQASLPLWLQALSGNQADASSFPGQVKAYVEQLSQEEESPCFVVDTALYSANTLQELGELRWVSRVPASIGEVKTLYQTVKLEQMLEVEGGRYRIYETTSSYADIQQRWLLVFSPATYEREAKQLYKRIDKERQEAEKVLRRLSRREYPNPEAAQIALETLAETWPFHTARIDCVALPRYHKSGRPAAGQTPDYYVYQPQGEIVQAEDAVQTALQTKGKFIIATNQLEADDLPSEALLKLYKDQNVTVERGFRFLKDPLFFAHSLFLKNPERLMALIMIMGLCLLIYAIAEHLLRAELVARDETLPNQTGKPTQRLTMRRVFQVFEGIDILTVQAPAGRQRLVLNLTDLHHRILDLLGHEVRNCYFFPP